MKSKLTGSNGANSAMRYSGMDSASIAPLCRHFSGVSRKKPAKNPQNSATDSATIAPSTAMEGLNMGAQMSENEFREGLKRHDLEMRDACYLLWTRTGVVVRADHIQTQFERSNVLSRTATALWRLFFKQLDKENPNEQRNRTV